MFFADPRGAEHGDAWTAEVERAEPTDEISDNREEEPRFAEARMRTLEEDAVFGLR